MSEIGLSIGKKTEKKEGTKMEKVKGRLLKEENIFELIKDRIEIPSLLKVTGKTGNVMDNGKEWAHLLVVDVDEERILSESGIADLAPIYRVKLVRYDKENLDNYIGKKIDVNSLEVTLRIDKNKQVDGIDFKSEFKNIKWVD